MHKVPSQVRALATAALKSGHALHGVVQPPSKWATAAGYEGSSASPLRQHIARQSGNGCGRTARYGAVDAQGMVNLIDFGVQFVEADTPAKQTAAAKKTATLLSKAKSAGRQGAKQAKTTAKRQVKSGKAKTTPKAKAPAKDKATA